MGRFVECFWGADFTSTVAFDVLSKRMRDGKEMCQDFENFIKQRADAEEKYGRCLIKLAKSAEGKDEIGTLKESWETLKTETENVGNAHLLLAQQLLDHLEKHVREFKETQREKRKRVEETVKRAQKNKKLCFDTTLKGKRNYEQKCREQDGIEDALKRSVSTQNTKEEEKLRVKLGRAKTAAEQSDTTYQNSVRSLEDARDTWEKEMESCCNFFQVLEEERIAFLRNAMWVYTNFGSLNCVKVDEIYEEMRRKLERCEVESDINLFISMKQTGSERPARIEYENYYVSQSSHKTTPLTSGGNISGLMMTRSKEASSVPSPRMGGRPQPLIPADSEVDSTYSRLEDFKQQDVRPKVSMCRALFPYEAQGDQELSFKSGEVIKILYEEDDVWWCGEIRGKKGMFPKTYVDRV